MNQPHFGCTATVLTFSLVGLEPHPVRIEVDVARGVAQLHLIGLPEASARESRVRVRAALLDVGVELDELVLTVQVCPATSGSFDLAIVVGILAAIGRIPAGALDGNVILGELSLSGTIQRMRGVLPILRGAQGQGLRRAMVPLTNAAEAAHVAGIEVRAAGHVVDVLAHFTGERPLAVVTAPPVDLARLRADVDLADLRDQLPVRRALEVAAAGAHHLLFVGPPGCGKTIAARMLPTILPLLSQEEAMEVTAIHSIAGLVPDTGLVAERPFRAPHHTVSAVGLVGGGDPVRPGEVSLAHHGCLFLDEIAEFRRGAIEALRQPLDEGVVTLCRARERTTFPAKTIVVAALSPCPCGFFGDPSKRCECPIERIRAYRARLDGTLLDRLDLQVVLRPVASAEARPPGEPSARVRQRVVTARAIQADRARRGEVGASVNAALSTDDLDVLVHLDVASRGLLKRAVQGRGIPTWTYDKVRRVARTVADLDGSTAVKSAHVEEAIQLTALLDPTCAAAPSDLRRPHAQGAQGRGQQGHTQVRKAGNKDFP